MQKVQGLALHSFALQSSGKDSFTFPPHQNHCFIYYFCQICCLVEHNFFVWFLISGYKQLKKNKTPKKDKTRSVSYYTEYTERRLYSLSSYFDCHSGSFLPSAKGKLMLLEGDSSFFIYVGIETYQKCDITATCRNSFDQKNKTKNQPGINLHSL